MDIYLLLKEKIIIPKLCALALARN